MFLPIVSVSDWYFIAFYPFIDIWLKSLHPVASYGASTIIIRLIPVQSNGILSDIRCLEFVWRSRWICVINISALVNTNSDERKQICLKL